jgi:adenylate cyclase
MSSYHAIGDMEGARRAARVALARAEQVMAHDHVVSGASIGCAASALAVLGEHEQARDLIERALLIDPDNLRMRYNFACGAVIYLKDIELALELLRPVFEGLNASWLRYAGCDPDLEVLRGDPRYVAMVKAAELRTASEDAESLAVT